MGPVHQLHNVIIISFRNNQSSVQNTLIQEFLNHIGLKCTENIAGSKMNPPGILHGSGTYSVSVIRRNLISFFDELLFFLPQSLIGKYQ